MGENANIVVISEHFTITIYSLHVLLVILVINIIVHHDIAIVFLQIDKHQFGFGSNTLDHHNIISGLTSY